MVEFGILDVQRTHTYKYTKIPLPVLPFLCIHACKHTHTHTPVELHLCSNSHIPSKKCCFNNADINTHAHTHTHTLQPSVEVSGPNRALTRAVTECVCVCVVVFPVRVKRAVLRPNRWLNTSTLMRHLHTPCYGDNGVHGVGDQWRTADALVDRSPRWCTQTHTHTHTHTNAWSIIGDDKCIIISVFWHTNICW